MYLYELYDGEKLYTKTIFIDDMADENYRKTDWTKLLMKLDYYGVSALIKALKDTNIKLNDFETIGTITFPKPVEMVLCDFGNEEITRMVSEVRGEFHYDYYWIKGRNTDKCNGISIWFEITEYLR